MPASVGTIGIFDSGVGGLSVLTAVRSELPHHDLVYVADSAHVPYAQKPAPFIEQRSLTITRFLMARGARAVVVACNTATGLAVDTLRGQFSIPIVGIEPAVKPAAAATRSGVIGVLATEATLGSERFSRLLTRHASGIRVLVQSCPGLVEQVEKGELSHDRTRALAQAYVAPLLEQGADTLVLGCTHYPFVQDLIEAIAGPGVTVIDPAAAVARELRRRLDAEGRVASPAGVGSERFFTSGAPDQVMPVVARLLRRPADVEPLPEP